MVSREERRYNLELNIIQIHCFVYKDMGKIASDSFSDGWPFLQQFQTEICHAVEVHQPLLFQDFEIVTSNSLHVAGQVVFVQCF